MEKGMKSWAKLAISGAVLCGVLLLFAFTSKGKNAETEVEDALEKLKKVKSMETTLTMNMDAEVLKLKLSASAAMDMVSFSDPLKVKADMTVDLGWLGSSDFQAYAYETEDNCRLYLKKGRRWVGEEVEADQLKRYNGKQMIETYLEQLDELVKEGEDDLGTGKAYRYKGVIHNTGLENVLLDTGCIEMLLTLLEQDMLKPLGSFFRKNEELIPELMRRAEDMEVLLWIDQKTGYPVRCSMDITYMVNAALEEFVQADSSEDTKGKKGFLQKAKSKLMSTIQVPSTQIVINCGAFNEAEDFQIPE